MCGILVAPVLISLVFCLLLYVYLTSTFDFWLVRGVPYRKPLPLFGNFADMLLFRKSQPEGISDMYNWFKNERFFGVFRVRTPILIIKDPEIVASICLKDFPVFCNRGIPVNSTKDPLSMHLFNLEGQHWKSLREKLTPAFSSGKLKYMFYLLIECSDELTLSIERHLSAGKEQAELEMRDMAVNFTIDVIGSCAFGIHINALTNESSVFRKTAWELSKPSYKRTLWRMLRIALPTLYKLLGVQVIDSSVSKFFMDVVSQIIKERKNNSSLRRHDFMDLLIQLKNKETARNELFLDLDLAAQAFVFFVAGYETSSNTISFCLYELALNPEIQKKTRRDVLDALDKHNGIKLTYDAVQDMKYLEMVITETLRKYPPAPMISRRCECAYKLPGSNVDLPKGTRVVIPIYAIHHDPHHYPNPSVFKPERFSDECKRARHAYTFLAFGQGPRNCIGARFALLLTKVGIITILRNYQVEICDKVEVPIKFSKTSLVTASQNGIRLKITRLSEVP